ncbi:hypothetical protein RCL1_009163 [Eukaryota sp. TZLM3-RCL]
MFSPTGTDMDHLNGESVRGIWLKQSLINHSCVPNCTRIFVGDFMFAFTTTEIHPGEEICCSCIDFSKPFSERREELSNHCLGFGFTCKCERCKHGKELDSMEKDVCKLVTAVMSNPMIHLDSIVSKSRRNEILSKMRSLPSPLNIRILEAEGIAAMYSNKGEAAFKYLMELRHQIVKGRLDGVPGPISTFPNSIRLLLFAVSIGVDEYSVALMCARELRRGLLHANVNTRDEFKSRVSKLVFRMVQGDDNYVTNVGVLLRDACV